MENEFFRKAAQDPALMRETIEALQRVVGHSPSKQDDVRDLVQRAQTDPKLKSAMADAIRAIAAKHGLSFTPEKTSSNELTDEQLAMVAGGKDNPTQVLISMPIVFLFVAAALIFLPSIFKTAGETMFGDASGGFQ